MPGRRPGLGAGGRPDARTPVRAVLHFADGYGLWGDMLARRRRWAAAPDRYDLAPR